MVCSAPPPHPRFPRFLTPLSYTNGIVRVENMTPNTNSKKKCAGKQAQHERIKMALSCEKQHFERISTLRIVVDCRLRVEYLYYACQDSSPVPKVYTKAPKQTNLARKTRIYTHLPPIARNTGELQQYRDKSNPGTLSTTNLSRMSAYNDG